LLSPVTTLQAPAAERQRLPPSRVVARAPACMVEDVAMMEDPEIIRLNIRHYQELLKLRSKPETRQQVLKLIVEAQAQLVLAVADAADRKR